MMWQVGPMSAHAWAEWGRTRPRSDYLHLDTAAAGRSSEATLAAVVAHALLEAEVGGYVAAEIAAPQLQALRADVARVLGSDVEGVAFVESATAGLVALLQAWPLREGARVGVAGSEWGPNLDLLDHRGLSPSALTTDGRGVLDLEALEQLLRSDPPDLVLLDHVAAHRGLVQPAVDVVRLCRAAGVPLWIDAAQSAGHVAIPAGADAVFATSRKWLTGPRGVGMVAVAPESRDQLRVAPLGKKPGASPMQLMESDEAHVAGRVGLGVAVREQLDLGLAAVSTRLVEVGQQLREAVANMAGWEVLQPDAPAGAITALMATAGQDVAQVQRGLLEKHRIVTTLALPWRAPRESSGIQPPLLRLSPHVDLDAAALERLAGALQG